MLTFCVPNVSSLPCLREQPLLLQSIVYYTCFLFSSLLWLSCWFSSRVYCISCPDYLKPEYSEAVSNWGLHSVSFWTILDGSRILANVDYLGLTLSTNVCKKLILSLFASTTSTESWTLSSILRVTLCLFFVKAFCC